MCQLGLKTSKKFFDISEKVPENDLAWKSSWHINWPKVLISNMILAEHDRSWKIAIGWNDAPSVLEGIYVAYWMKFEVRGAGFMYDIYHCVPDLMPSNRHMLEKQKSLIFMWQVSTI